MIPVIKEIYESVVDGQKDSVVEKVNTALEAGTNVSTVLNEGLIAAMGEVGRLFEAGDFFVPEMLIAGRAMQSGLNVLKPYLQDENVSSIGKVVIGTVKGDLHDIGKNLVGLMLEGAGFEVIDLGADVAPEEFVEAARANNAQLVGLSALLTTTMLATQSTVEAFREADLPGLVAVIIGGAPVTQEYSEEIGSDGFAPDATRAVNLAKELIKAGKQ